jgi:hypothetical protein
MLKNVKGASYTSYWYGSETRFHTLLRARPWYQSWRPPRFHDRLKVEKEKDQQCDFSELAWIEYDGPAIVLAGGDIFALL